MLSAINKLIPHTCVFCGDNRERKQVCSRCVAVLPWNDLICECCGQPVVAMLPAGVCCAACQKRPPAFAKARSLFHYAFPIDTALKAMKFRSQLLYAPAFATLLMKLLCSEFASCDVLIAVPLHRWRYVKRGFNQSAEMCKELEAHTALRQFHGARRILATRTQSGLTSAGRRKNLRNAFSIEGTQFGRYPLIIDDVITTGATCEHLARALLAAGAEKVGVLTVARSSTLVS